MRLEELKLDGSLRLPIPKPSDGEAFRALYQKEYGITLSPEEGLELARKVMGIIYVQQHTLLFVRKEELGK